MKKVFSITIEAKVKVQVVAVFLFLPKNLNANCDFASARFREGVSYFGSRKRPFYDVFTTNVH